MKKALLLLKRSKPLLRERQITIDLAVSDGVLTSMTATMFCKEELVVKLEDGREAVEVNILVDLSELEGYVVVSIGSNPRIYRVPSSKILRLS
jgi:hypothetical protein